MSPKSQRFIVVLGPSIPVWRRYVGLFRSIKTAEGWANANAFDRDGFQINWSVEPVERP